MVDFSVTKVLLPVVIGIAKMGNLDPWIDILPSCTRALSDFDQTGQGPTVLHDKPGWYELYCLKRVVKNKNEN